MPEAKILIIDDDEDMVEAMKRTLEIKPYKVITAASGEEGFNKAKAERPDLVVLDVMMETADKGFDISRRIRRDRALSAVPILMLTAIRERTGFDFSAEAGDETWLPVDDYLEKPLRPDQLLAKVERFLE